MELTVSCNETRRVGVEYRAKRFVPRAWRDSGIQAADGIGKSMGQANLAVGIALLAGSPGVWRRDVGAVSAAPVNR